MHVLSELNTSSRAFEAAVVSALTGVSSVDEFEAMSGERLAEIIPDVTQRRALLQLHGLGRFRDLVDTDGDGLISFGEYVFFVTLLAVSTEQLRRTFREFDRDGSGTLDRDEFLQMMQKVRGSMDYGRQVRDRDLLGRDLGRVRTGGDLTRFFGEDGKRALSLGEFEGYVAEVRRAVLRHEFREADGDGNGWLSGAEFARLLLPFASPDQAEAWGARAQRRLVAMQDRAAGASERAGQRVLFPEYERFDRLVRSQERLRAALEAAEEQSGAGGVDREWFGIAAGAVLRSSSPAEAAAAVRGAGAASGEKAHRGAGLSAYQVEVIFALFDADGDGTLSREEFLDVVSKRASRGLSEARTFWLWDKASSALGSAK